MPTPKSVVGAVCAAALTLALSFSPTVAKDVQTMTEDQTAVLNAVLTMTKAFHAADPIGVGASYAEDAVVMFEPGVPTRGREQIAAGFKNFFAVKPHFTYSGHQVHVSGDRAVHIAPWDMTGTAPDGTAIRQSGLSVAVLVRGDDDVWRIAIDDPYGNKDLVN